MTSNAPAITFGQRIRERREELGYSQTTVGAMCGVSWQAVQQWENDSTEPKAHTIPYLNRALELEAGKIVTWLEHAPKAVELAATLPGDAPSIADPGWKCLRQITGHLAAATGTLVPYPTPTLKVA